MGIATYYLSKQEVSGVGELFLLNDPQYVEESDGGTGGGDGLLGSIVQQIKAPLHKDYPVPLSTFEPRILIETLNDLKAALGINKVTIKSAIAPAAQHFSVTKNSSFQLGFGPFPTIPFGGKIQVDHSSIKTIDLTYGEGTRFEYIPKGNMIVLRQHLEQNPMELDTKPMLKTAIQFLKHNAYISHIQLAKNWAVSFESSKTFDTGIDAHLDVFNQDSLINGKVELKRTSETTIKAEVHGETEYLVMLMSTRWDDLKID